MKYSYEEKLRFAKLVVECGCSVHSVSQSSGITWKQVRSWATLYETYGAEGLEHKIRTYSGEFKLHVLRYMRENKLSLFATSLKFGIPDKSVLAYWERIYSVQGESGLFRERGFKKKTMKDKKAKTDSVAALQAELQLLRAENDYLKKLQALVWERQLREKENGYKSSKN